VGNTVVGFVGDIVDKIVVSVSVESVDDAIVGICVMSMFGVDTVLNFTKH